MKTRPPEYRWQIFINPSYSWFESFAHDFSSPDLTITLDHEDERPTAFGLTSSHLTELTDEAQVWDRVFALKCILDGALYLDIGSGYYPFSLGELYDFKNQRRGSLQRRAPDPSAHPYSSNADAWLPQWDRAMSPFVQFESS